MTVLYIAGTHQSESSPFAHCLGDVVTSIKVAWLWYETEKPTKTILSLCENEQWNCLWTKFIRETGATVICDQKCRNKSEHYRLFDQRRRERQINGIQFDVYKELYTRMEGGQRQHALCGEERGLGRKNIFEYFYYGQESFVENPQRTTEFGTDIIDFTRAQRKRKVLIAPHAKCQGNHVFTYDFWRRVVEKLIDAKVDVTINDDHDRIGIRDSCQVRMSQPENIANDVAEFALLACGNTGIGWVAGATGTPLFGMEPPWFNMMDFRYRECGVQSLRKLFSEPAADHVAVEIIKFMEERS